METRKLYYEDCLIKEFTATVIRCEQCETGYWVELDATAFFPGGGGQACDLGTLDGVALLDMKEAGETVLHLCRQPLTVGQTVEGKLDWSRRLDQMQQHSGEHIVSGIIYERFGATLPNSGFFYCISHYHKTGNRKGKANNEQKAAKYRKNFCYVHFFSPIAKFCNIGKDSIPAFVIDIRCCVKY